MYLLESINCLIVTRTLRQDAPATRAYQLPAPASQVTVCPALLVTATTATPPALQACSAHLAQCGLEGEAEITPPRPESLLQSWDLQQDERVLQLLQLNPGVGEKDSGKETKPGLRKLVCLTTDETGQQERTELSNPGTGTTTPTTTSLAGRARAGAAAAEGRAAAQCGPVLVVTTRQVALLHLTSNPAQQFLAAAMAGRANQADSLTKAFQV